MEEDEDYNRVTVETKTVSVGDEGVYLLNHVQINTISHCIFCLNKTAKNSVSRNQPAVKPTGDDNVPQQTVPRANLNLSCSPSSQSQFLSTLNQTWEYLQKKYKNNGPDPSSFLESIQSREEDAKKRNTMTFLDIPILCILCAETMEAICILFEDLTAQLNVLGKIMQDSKDCGKYQHFESSLKNSNLEGGVIAATIKLLDHLGGEPEIMNDFHSDDESNEEGMETERDPLADIDATVNPVAGIESQAGSMSPDGSRYPKRQLMARKAESRQDFPLALSPDYKSEEASTSDDDDFDDVDDRNDTDTQPELYCKSELDDSSSSEDSQETRTLTLPRILKRQTSSTSSPSRKKKKIAPPTYNERIERIESSCDKTCSKEPINAKESSLQDQIMKNRRLFSMAFVPCIGRNQFICQVDKCGESFADLDVLWKHQAKSHRPKIQENNCDVCGRSFDCAKDLQLHKKRVHVVARGSTQICDLCKVAVPRTEIYEHVRAHIGAEYMIKCPNPKCTDVYSNASSLSVHLKQRSIRCRGSIPNADDFLAELKSTMEKCQVCGEQGMNRQSLRGHLDRMHENHVKNLSCPIDGCGQQFTVRQSVVLHIGWHSLYSPSDKQKCDQCNVDVKVEQMENHLKERHGVGAEAVVKCNLCRFLFLSRENLLDHLLEHRGSVLSCDICHVKFTRHVKLREHYLSFHNIGQLFHCDFCKKTFSARYTLTEHVRNKHSGGKGQQNNDSLNVDKKREKKHKCDVCDAAYSQSTHLQDHKIRLHGETRYACKVCAETFTTWKLYSQHEREHVGVTAPEKKKVKCDVDGCEKTFQSNSHLRKHISSAHHGLKPHICELCGKAYGHASGLKSHKESVHFGLRFICDECGESFNCGQTLKRHKRIHTGEKDFTCEICCQKFGYKEVLKRHLEGHQRKGADFKPKGPMKQIRKRVEIKKKH